MAVKDVTTLSSFFSSYQPDPVPFSEAEISHAIKSLNSGKACDGTGITAERLKYATVHITPALTIILNQVLKCQEMELYFRI